MRLKQTLKKGLQVFLTITLIVGSITPTALKNVQAANVNLGQISRKTPSHEKLIEVKTGQSYDISFSTDKDANRVSVQIMKPQCGSDVSLDYEVKAEGSTGAKTNGNLKADYVGTTTTSSYEPNQKYVLHIENIKCKGNGKIVVCVFASELGGKEADRDKWNKKVSITVTPNSSCLLQGKKITLKAKYDGKNTNNVQWKSSNNKIVTVSKKGVVKAKKPGKATITCSLKTDSNIKGECYINVYAKAKKITLNKKKKTIYAKESYTLRAKVKPKGATYQDVIWKSSNPKVARVNQFGEVTGVKKGKATITATVKYKKKSSVKATCKITVKKARKSNNKYEGVSINVKYPMIMLNGGSQVFYTLQTGKYSGKLNLQFKVNGYSAQKSVTVKKNTTYQLTTYMYLSGMNGTTIPGITPIWLPPTYHTNTVTIFASGSVLNTVALSQPGTLTGISIPDNFCQKIS